MRSLTIITTLELKLPSLSHAGERGADEINKRTRNRGAAQTVAKRQAQTPSMVTIRNNAV